MWHENHVNIAHEIQLQYPELWDEILAMRAQGMRSFDPPVRGAFASVQDVIRFYDASNSKKRLTEPGMQNDDAYRRFVGEDVDFLLGGEMAGIDMRPELHKISARTLVLAGRYDRALYPKYQLQFKKHLPHADFRWMERSGSFSHVEEQDEVLRLLRAFF
jgi:proline iminopeptidase